MTVVLLAANVPAMSGVTGTLATTIAKVCTNKPKLQHFCSIRFKCHYKAELRLLSEFETQVAGVSQRAVQLAQTTQQTGGSAVFAHRDIIWTEAYVKVRIVVLFIDVKKPRSCTAR